MNNAANTDYVTRFFAFLKRFQQHFMYKPRAIKIKAAEEITNKSAGQFGVQVEAHGEAKRVSFTSKLVAANSNTNSDLSDSQKLGGSSRNCSNNTQEIPLNTSARDTSTENMKREDRPEIGAVVRSVLEHAKHQGRITCGLHSAVKLLEIDPTSVMLVVLPESSFDDATLHIHHTLIEAFCWENDIRLLKVDEAEKLGSILEDWMMYDRQTLMDHSSKCESDEEDGFHCVLVQYPCGWNESIKEEEDLIEYYKSMEDLFHQPVIELPV